MSLIEKIDAEIERVSRIPIFNDCTDTDEIFDEGKKSGWYEEAVRIKEIILSEQKEPITIGDKIRESNESLARCIEALVAIALGDSSFIDVERRIEWLNQPQEGE